jgi:hypothetical protein
MSEGDVADEPKTSKQRHQETMAAIEASPYARLAHPSETTYLWFLSAAELQSLRMEDHEASA